MRLKPHFSKGRILHSSTIHFFPLSFPFVDMEIHRGQPSRGTAREMHNEGGCNLSYTLRLVAGHSLKPIGCTGAVLQNIHKRLSSSGDKVAHSKMLKPSIFCARGELPVWLRSISPMQEHTLWGEAKG